MDIKEYLDRNLPNLNFNILPQIFEENNVELTEEIRAYLKETPWNTNWNIIENLISGKDEEESWPKLIHIIYDNDYRMANDSDFSTLAEAYNFIKNKWGVEGVVTSNYIILKHLNNIIETDGHIKDNEIDWYSGSTVYELTENSYSSFDDN